MLFIIFATFISCFNAVTDDRKQISTPEMISVDFKNENEIRSQSKITTKILLRVKPMGLTIFFFLIVAPARTHWAIHILMLHLEM